MDNNEHIEINLLNERPIYGVNSSIMQITVDGDGSSSREFYRDPYFKIHDKRDFTHAPNKTRISILRPEYVIHNNNIWILSSSEIKELIRILSGKVESNMNTWEYILDEVISESLTVTDLSPEYIKYISSLPMPDYTNIVFSEKDLKKHNGAIKSWHKKK